MALILGLQYAEQIKDLAVRDEFEQMMAAIQSAFNAITPFQLPSTYQPAAITAPTGSGKIFFGDVAPEGWFLCQGQAVSRTDNAALFAVIGTKYGAGDGTTTFNLPNIQDRFPIGKGALVTTLGATGGSFDHTHAHTHSISGSTATTAINHAHTFSVLSGTPSAQRNVDVNGDGFIHLVGDEDHTHGVGGSTAGTDVDITHGHGAGSLTADSGGGSASNNPPYLVVNWIIKR